MNSKAQPKQLQSTQPDAQTSDAHNLAAQASAPNRVEQARIAVHNASSFATPAEVKLWIKAQAQGLGFADCGFLSVHHPLFIEQTEHLKQWLAKGYEGQLQFMHHNHHLRAQPEQLVEGAKTIISVRMDYLTQTPTPRAVTDNAYPNQGIIARYARGRDYHKTMRSRLKQLALKIEAMLPEWQHLNIGSEQDFIFAPLAILRLSLSVLLPMRRGLAGRANIPCS